jgi:hypothetical protein
MKNTSKVLTVTSTFLINFFRAMMQKFPRSLIHSRISSLAQIVKHWAFIRVRRFRLYIFFASQRKKIPYFSLSFALSEYERRTLRVPVSLIYFFASK